jgi:hypothetical protein
MSRQETHPRPRRRSARAALVAAMTVVAAATLAPAAGAAVQSASLSMTSDAGDYIGQGQTYAYATSSGDSFNPTNTAAAVNVSVYGANGDWWYVNLSAPSGESLAAGTYSSAERFSSSTAPGLDVWGNGRGCNAVAGSFTVTQISFHAGGTIDSLDASFEQHCEGAEPALRGELHIVNVPPPPPLTIGLAFEPSGSASSTGTATVRGTLTCNTPTTVYLFGTLTQKVTRFAVASGNFSSAVECSGTTPWQATISPGSSVPFGPGMAQLKLDASGYDHSGELVHETTAGTVRLGR